MGLGGAVALSHGTRRDYNTVTGLELLPHVGYVALSDTTTLAVGYRHQHISNATACSVNFDINSSALYLGVNFLFR